MNYVLRLPGEAVDGSHVCCLGSQLVRIITLLNTILGDVAWYVGDVEATGERFQHPTYQLKFVGNSQQLVQTFQKVDQFLRGVFLAVKADVSEPQLRSSIDTEDPVDVHLGDAIVEIRAFDTSYFEVLTRDTQIADFVAKTFSVPVVPL